MDNIKELTLKKPLTIDEQIEYLKNTKRVVFNEISEEKAKEILSKYGYINVITPFKFYFAKRNGWLEERDENNKHIYERDIDFSEYYSSYTDERAKYPTIYKNLYNFETTFNAIVAYETIQFYHLDSLESFNKFTDKLMLNLISYPNQDRKQHMIESIVKWSEGLEEYGSIFIFMDRLTLNETITLFRSVDENLRKLIFKKLTAYNNTLGYSRQTDFDNILSDLVRIRNYVFHGNSLTILVRYKLIKEKKIRRKDEADSIKKLIKKLSQ